MRGTVLGLRSKKKEFPELEREEVGADPHFVFCGFRLVRDAR